MRDVVLLSVSELLFDKLVWQDPSEFDAEPLQP